MEKHRREKWHRHWGIYGVCINSFNEILVVKKNGGPYTGRFDLPGGLLENPEGLIEGLKREILEETGYEITVIDSLGSYDFLLNSAYNGFNYTQHIALFYKIVVFKQTRHKIDKYVIDNANEAENDSLGSEWVNIAEINISNLSPLVVKACMIVDQKTSKKFDIEVYTNWLN